MLNKDTQFYYTHIESFCKTVLIPWLIVFKASYRQQNKRDFLPLTPKNQPFMTKYLMMLAHPVRFNEMIFKTMSKYR